MPDEATRPARPLLTVVRGEPTLEQVAALTAVLASRCFAEAADGGLPPEASLWALPVLRTSMSPGAGAWRASGLTTRS